MSRTMNYFIQGDAANADQIKAAFEKLGYDVTGFDMCNDNVLFFTYKLQTGANVISTTNAHSYTANIIKTHPDYKELKLPIEHCFKVGDWVVFNNSHNSIYQISEIRDSYYMLTHTHGGSMSLSFSQGKLLRPWSIADAKDGDVLATDNGWACIFKAFDERVFSSYCFMDSQKWFCEFGSEAHTLDSRINGNIHPATKEQHDLLFAKIKEAGYQWDVDKKELRKIKPHYNISNFHAGMPVLVRDNNKEWRYVPFSHITNGQWVFNAVGTVWEQCIPFNEDTKHLLGTTDMCDKMYVNW